MKNQATTAEAFSEDEISALADGALHGDAFDSAMRRLATDGQARACWHAYHVVGDALRSDDLADGTGDLAFLSRLEARLALEPASLVQQPPAPSLPMPAQRPAANNDVFRWKLAAGFASLAAVAAIGWQSLQLQAPPSGAVLAQNSTVRPSGFQAVRADVQPAESGAPAVGNDTQPVMLRNAQLDELLAAHSRAVGGAALQSQARMLRNVSITEELPR